MASRVIMPKLTDSMEEGVVVKWRKAEGEFVESGDVLAEIETDKAVMDLEAFASGTLRKILVPEGTTVPSGTLIAVIGESDEDIQEILAGRATTSESATSTSRAATSVAVTTPAGTVPATESPVSPRVRTLAREHGIDLGAIKGSGPGGRIVERDLEGLIGRGKGGVESAVREVPLTQMRKAIIRMTTQSKGPVPHFYVASDADMNEGLRLVEESKKQTAHPHISINHLVIGAAARALVQHPGLNASFAGETIRLFPTIDIGIAVGLEDGLIVPVLRDCGRKTFAQLVEEERVLVARARNRELSPHEYTGATFAISNLGMFDVESFIAVILPPAAAVLAVGAVREIPVARDGRVEIGQRLKLTLSCDHRVVDGVAAAKFLQTLKYELEHPHPSLPPRGGG